jgi:hypothetical protein
MSANLATSAVRRFSFSTSAIVYWTTLATSDSHRTQGAVLVMSDFGSLLVLIFAPHNGHVSAVSLTRSPHLSHRTIVKSSILALR